MTHEIGEPIEGKLGFGCSCGRRFPVKAAALRHAEGENEREAKESEQLAREINTEVDAQAQPQPTESAEEVIKEDQVTKSFGDLSPFDQAKALVQTGTLRLYGEEEMKRAALFANTLSVMARREPKLQLCSRDSLVTAMMASVQLNLLPNTPEQFCHIIPFKNNRSGEYEAQFIIGYRGMQKLAYNTTTVQLMNAECVFPEDDFDFELGLERRLWHKPNMDIDRTDYDRVSNAYATAKLASGEVQFVVLTKREIDKARAVSKAKSTDSPWFTWGTRMAQKTVVKRLCNVLPFSTKDHRLSDAVTWDSWSEAGVLRHDKDTYELIQEPANALPEPIESKINGAESRQQLNQVLQGLSIEDRKRAVPLVQVRMKELA